MSGKRLVFALLSLMTVVALLSGCAAQPAPAPPPTAPPAAVEPTQAPAEAAAAPEPTAMPTEAPPPEPTRGEVVEVKYTYAGVIPQDLQMVQDAINALLEPAINTRLILEPIDWGSFNDKVTLRFSAGEPCDIVFTAPWINSYVQNVANGNLLPLDDLLPTYAPGLWASMPKSTWEAARVSGKIYGVINQQIFPKPWGIEVRKDMADKYGLDLNSIKRWEDMEPFLQKVKEGEGITPEYWCQDPRAGDTYFMHQYWGFDPIDDGIGGGGVGMLGIRADDPNLKVLLMPETPEFMEAMTLTYKFVQEGLIPADPLPCTEADAAYRAGQYAYSHHVEKPGNEAELKNAFGYDFVIKNLTDPLILDTAGATATLNGICATSKHPENAMMVLEMLNTNKDVYTLLARGIEGKHWVWVDKAQNLAGFPPGVTGETSTYNPNTDWMFGNQFNAPYRDPIQIGAWPKTKEMNDTAMPSQALGFTFERTAVETELAQVASVYAELFLPINDGTVDPVTEIPKLVDELKKAGIEKIMAEMQSQLDAWKAAKK
jgi:putative aldouronate transport system substrate-binding protein